MPEIDAKRQALKDKRQELASLDQPIFLHRERLKKIEGKEARLNRKFDPQNKDHQATLARLQQEKLTLKRAIDNKRGLVNDATVELQTAWIDFLRHSDPRSNLNQLNDNFPILMLPLRIETRFKKVDFEGRQRDQLWVRVFPDDCAIDTFEEYLSDAEIQNAQDFWAAWWVAAGQKAARRAAWRGLVGGHGSGRAQYVFNQYKPKNPADEPSLDTSNPNPQIFLVTATEDTIAQAEKDALAVFWEAVWRAYEDAALLQAAQSALEAAVGEDRAAVLAEHYAPHNIDSPFAGDRSQVSLSVVFLKFPPEEQLKSQALTWSKAPTARVMPERLVLLGYRGDALDINEIGNAIPFPLVVGPDPVAEEADQIKVVNGDIQVSEGMKWMVDFEEAVEKGMGFKVWLTPQQVESGIDKLMVVGVRMSADETEGRELFEELIDHHYSGNSGFSFLPVGTPTNNTLGSGSGHSQSEDADESFALLFKPETPNDDPEIQSWWTKTDRDWFAEMLGLDPEIFAETINTNGFDQREARAMNLALWPATWGYFFESMMQPLFKEHEVDLARWFFNYFVVGRGAIPSIRIDDQPYGILPTTAYSKMKWLRSRQIPPPLGVDVPDEVFRLLPRLYGMFMKIQQDWKTMKQKVDHVGKEGDPHQVLLSILGLHGGSVEFHQRYAESLNHLFNLYNMSAGRERSPLQLFPTRPTVTFEQLWKAVLNTSEGWRLLRDLGYKGQEGPEILEKVFVLTPNKLKGDLIDDLPLSETNPIRAYTSGNTPLNYIGWLINAAGTSFDSLRKEAGFTDNKRPNALLYLMLKHAMELEFWESSLRLYLVAELLDTEHARIAKIEPDFIHLRNTKANIPASSPDSLSQKPLDYPFASESKYHLLYQAQPGITNDNTLPVGQYITQVYKTHHATRYLWEQVKALRHLENVPTARLERAFVEHLDCTSYRFDAWKAGLVHYQLAAMRYQNEDSNGGVVPTRGLYLGAYGWLENVRSEHKVLEPISLEPDLEPIFDNPADNPIVRDNTNGGFIHAPSATHAVTAAVLRNGYLANATRSDPGVMAINLSSERVRLALSVLEGMRAGQSLAALLGYRLERYIHDRNPTANVDQYIFSIRRKFPLAGNQLKSTKVEETDPISIQAIEARNVVNGLDLINFVETRLGPNGEPQYFSDLGLGGIGAMEQGIIADAIEHIRDVNDAVADLGLAESVHQVVQGNIDRAAGTLDTYSKGGFPQPPDVVQTPRSGVNLSHRVGLHIPANADPNVPGYTPRAQAEPGLNRFLADLFPDLATIFCTVDFFHAGSNAAIQDFDVTMASLGLQPIDLLYLLDMESEQAMSSLDEQVIHYIQTQYPGGGAAPDPPRPDAEVAIRYFEKKPGKVSLFEFMPLVRQLRSLFLAGRELRPGDVMLNVEATQKKDRQLFLDKQRLVLARAGISPVQAGLTTYVNNLKNSIETDDEATRIAGIDAWIDNLVGILVSLNATGMPQTGFGFTYAWRKSQMEAILTLADTVIQRWDDNLSQFQDLIDDYAALPATATDEEKFKLLRTAEKLVSSSFIENPDSDPDIFRNAVLLKRPPMVAKKAELENFMGANHQQLAACLSAAETVLVYETLDAVATDFSEIKTAILAFLDELSKRAQSLKTDLDKRMDKAAGLLTVHDAESSPAKKVETLREMAKLLLSEDFKMIPSFSLNPEQAAEWQNALNHQTELLSYQVSTLNNPLPVDDWFYGVSRVREKMGHLEQMLELAEGFKAIDLELTPAQFPYQKPYRWFALEFGDPDADTAENLKRVFRENDHLLYTAYYHQPFNSSQSQCGLLLDEWTEVVPTETETSGIAFHYDRPNSEAPQTLLLVTPPQFQQAWQWEDLVDALHETLEEAKLRAVEPSQIDQSSYANFLPATISMVSRHPISIMMNYALNNDLFTQIQGGDDNE